MKELVSTSDMDSNNFSRVNGSFFNDYMDEDFFDVTSVIVPLLFGLIFLVGLLGNGVLIMTVLLNGSLRTKPNILIVSLALGDFLMILISVPFTIVPFTFQEWIFGEAICKLNESMQTLSLGVSNYVSY